MISTSTSLSARVSKALVQIPEELISLQARDFIYRYAELWPHDCTPFWGVELDLCSGKNDADFLFCVHRPSDFDQIIEGFSKHPNQDFSKRLESFRTMLSSKEEISRDIVNIWFEYDHKYMDRPISFPNFFFAPRKNIHPIQMVHIAEMVFSSVDDGYDAASELGLLLGLNNILPDNSWISQIGKMYLRDEKSVRLYIQDFEVEQVIPFLSRAKLEFIPEAILNQVMTLSDKCNATIGIDLDISRKIGSGIGFEFYFKSIQEALLFLDQFPIEMEDKSAYLSQLMSSMKYQDEKDEQFFFSHFKWTYQLEKGSKLKAYIGWVKNKIASSVIRTKPIKHSNHEII